jgi:hypothetical protein
LINIRLFLEKIFLRKTEEEEIQRLEKHADINSTDHCASLISTRADEWADEMDVNDYDYIGYDETKGLFCTKKFVTTLQKNSGEIISFSIVVARSSIVAVRSSIVATRSSIVAARSSKVAARSSKVATRSSIVAARSSKVATRIANVVARSSIFQ